MSFDKDLPSAQQLERGDPAAFKRLLLAIKQLQADAAPLSGLVAAGIARTNSKGVIFDPKVTDANPFDNTDTTVPDAPTNLAVTTTANLVLATWTIPNFQTILAYTEVWILNAPLFRDDTDYVIGDFVTYASVVYIFTSNHTAAVWDATDVSAAGVGDLVIDNAKDRYQTPVGSTVLSVDVGGGTAFLWARLISAAGIAGPFNSATPVVATAKSIPGALPIGCELASQASPGASFLEAAGQTINRADYLEFYSWASSAGIIYTEATKLTAQIGDGDGATTISLPDLRGRVPVAKSAAGTFSVLGSVGGSETVTLATTDIPSHSHGVTDPNHGHSISDPNHGHSLSDPNHSHSISDPNHFHTQQIDADSAAVGSAGSAGSNTANDTSVGVTDSAATGITVNSAATGVTVNSAATGVTVNSGSTGITIGNTGGGGAHNNLAPYYVTRVWIKVKP